MVAPCPLEHVSSHSDQDSWVKLWLGVKDSHSSSAVSSLPCNIWSCCPGGKSKALRRQFFHSHGNRRMPLPRRPVLHSSSAELQFPTLCHYPCLSSLSELYRTQVWQGCLGVHHNRLHYWVINTHRVLFVGMGPFPIIKGPLSNSATHHYHLLRHLQAEVCEDPSIVFSSFLANLTVLNLLTTVPFGSSHKPQNLLFIILCVVLQACRVHQLFPCGGVTGVPTSWVYLLAAACGGNHCGAALLITVFWAHWRLKTSERTLMFPTLGSPPHLLPQTASQPLTVFFHRGKKCFLSSCGLCMLITWNRIVTENSNYWSPLITNAWVEKQSPPPHFIFIPLPLSFKSWLEN